MCEICDGDYRETLTLEVSRAAFVAQHIDDFGPAHLVVDDANVDDEDLRFVLSLPDCGEAERILVAHLMPLSVEDRISALALSQARYGCVKRIKI